jgi:hypothetical protein
VIEILSSNLLMYRHGGEFSPFVAARIVAGIMRFIVNGMMIRPNAPGNIIGGGRVVALNEVFHVNLPTAVQKMRRVLEFYMSFGNGMSLPHLIIFSCLQRAWDAANLTLQDLMSPVVDCAVDPNDRNCPICLDLVLLQRFMIPACGHPMHMKCSKVYKNWMNTSNCVVTCPVCQFDTQGYCYQAVVKYWSFEGVTF